MLTSLILTLSLSFGASENPAPPSDPASEMTSQVQSLRDALNRLEAQRLVLEKQMATMQALLISSAEPAPNPMTRAATAAVEPKRPPDATVAVEVPAPISIRLGSAEFTPGGSVDFVGIFRSTNVGSGVSTGFGSLPMPNTVAGQMGENRFSAQTSRFNLKATSRRGETDIMGFLEVDFNGAQPANGLITSNSNPLRLRQYFVDVSRGGWEVLGGQAWSMLTPNRNGISTMPSDLFLATTIDTNYIVGLTYTRAPLVRVVRHWNKNWTSGVSFEGPDQFVGTSVTMPSTMFSSQLDNGSSVATPSLYPDIIAKAAFDGHVSERAIHVETAAIARGFRIVNQTNERITRNGGGASVNFNIETFKNLRVIMNTFASSGGGRYIGGLGPDLVLRPDGNPSLVRAASAIGGVEYQMTPGWAFGIYQSGAFFGRNYSYMSSGPIGYGFTGSASTANRTIQESTFTIVRTLWKRKDLGALQVLTQYSYAWREPWYVAPGAPDRAHSNIVFADLKYTLP